MFADIWSQNQKILQHIAKAQVQESSVLLSVYESGRSLQYGVVLTIGGIAYLVSTSSKETVFYLSILVRVCSQNHFRFLRWSLEWGATDAPKFDQSLN